MEEKKLWPMPIDNKHILEDFTDDFHGGEFVETVGTKIHRQAFWKCGVLCVISYEFGNNWFDLHIEQDDELKAKAAAKELSEVMNAYCENYVIKEGPGGVYLIFKEEE